MKKRMVVCVALSEELTERINRIVDLINANHPDRFYDHMMDDIQDAIIDNLYDCFPKEDFGEVSEAIDFADRNEAERMWNTYEIGREE